MSLRTDRLEPVTEEVHALREENRTLYGVINLVSSSLEVAPMLQGVVDLATEATGCHACFIYLLEGSQLTIRAASPVFREAVGKVQFSVDEGLAGWVARHRTPEFIRERAMDDPRMKYVPLLQEQRFQSMVAVPILSRAGETIGVIVLHTEAPHEFGEGMLKLLVHIASLVSGAIENAQLYDQERRRVGALTGLAEIAQQVADVTGAAELGEVIVAGSLRLLGADICQLLRLGSDGESMQLLASVPASLPSPSATSAADLMLTALEGRGGVQAAKALWPSAEIGDLLVVPLAAGGERVGLLCAALVFEARVRRRGRLHRARGRASGRRRDQARRADRGADERQHHQGPVRAARGGRDVAGGRQGGRDPLRSHVLVSDGLRASRPGRASSPRASGVPPPNRSGAGWRSSCRGPRSRPVPDRCGRCSSSGRPASRRSTASCTHAASSASGPARRSASASCVRLRRTRRARTARRWMPRRSPAR